MRVRVLACGLWMASVVAAAGCSRSSPADGGVPDGAPSDLAARADADAPWADLGVPPGDGGDDDLAWSLSDGGAPDDATAADLSGADLGPCQGGYLNHPDPVAACPLSCGPAVRAVPDEGAQHVPFGTPVQYSANPPASGSHWTPWATWGAHPEIVFREQWVHNLEHGGIVLLYNCPAPPDAGAPSDGGVPTFDHCPAEVAQLQALYNSWPVDNFFDLLFVTRILITADPLLPTRFAAVAWQWAWTGDTLDLAAIDCFMRARYGRGPEAAP